MGITNRWASKSDFQKNQYIAATESKLFPNLREEFHSFLYGSDTEIAKGFWIIHRKMDLSQESEHWDPENQEVYRGYRWVYTDHLLRIRRYTVPTGKSDEVHVLLGELENPAYIFWAEWDTGIKREDKLIEIEPRDALRKPRENQITFLKQYDIIRVDPVEGDLGRIEHLRIFARNPSPIGNRDFYTLRLSE